jgi:hypothetical protein
MLWLEQQQQQEQRIRSRAAGAIVVLQQQQQQLHNAVSLYSGKSNSEFLYTQTPVRCFFAVSMLQSLLNNQATTTTTIIAKTTKKTTTTTTTSIPVFVVVGTIGKANLIDALLGLSIFRGCAIKRPFQVCCFCCCFWLFLQKLILLLFL